MWEIDELETHYMAGGDIMQTTLGLINAKKAGIDIDWNRACTIDLATKGTEKSIMEAVRTSINPKVIDVPGASSGRATIDGVAKDGIQVKVRCRVTVRSNLERYVGSAQEETIIARVGEGIVDHHRLGRNLQMGAGKPRLHFQKRSRPRSRHRHGL